MALTWTATFAGTVDESDKLGAIWAVEKENEARALVDPPIPPLPYGTNAELKSSYQFLISERLASLHGRNVTKGLEESISEDNLKERWKAATDAQRAAALAELPEV